MVLYFRPARPGQGMGNGGFHARSLLQTIRLSTIPIEEIAVKRLKNVRVIMMSAMLAVAAATVSGCQGGASGALVKPGQEAAIVSGKTTKAELIKQLGEPDKTTDLGKGKEELLFVHENPAIHGSWFRPGKAGLWVILKNNVVEAFGERKNLQDQNTHRFWPF